MKKTTFLSIIVVVYVWIIVFLTSLLSVFDEEAYLRDDEIKNVCDVIKSYVVDDNRTTSAIAMLVAIVPVVIYCIKTNVSHIIVNISMIFFFMAWVWCFIIRFRNCLWF